MPSRTSALTGLLVAILLAAVMLSRSAEAQNPQFYATLQQELQLSREKLARTEQALMQSREQLREAKRRVLWLEEEMRLDRNDDRGEASTTIRRLRRQLAGMQNAKYAHYSVWRRQPFVPDQAADQFVTDAYTLLGGQASVRGAWVGPTSVPNEAGGEMVLLLLFADREAHKQYNEDPATRRFRDTHGLRWQLVKALDVVAK